jgi:UDP-N-acetyl-2-amino-2-deoxyglucuronate dehydrogenase
MSSKDKIKFAVCGCGHIGKRHADIIANYPECELVGLVDNRPINALGIDIFNAPFFNSLDDLIAIGPEFDVLCVTTPNGLHVEHSTKGLKSGHHVVIEKPMALSKAGCEKIIKESEQNRKHVFCVMQNRYALPSLWLKDILHRKLLGKIFIVQVNCYWNRDKRYYKEDSWHGTKELDGGTLFTQFSHFVDTILWLFGDLQNICARLCSLNHNDLTQFEDSGFISFDISNGGMGCLNFSTSVWNENLESTITIIGEKGTVKVGGQYMNEVLLCNIKDYSMPSLLSDYASHDHSLYNASTANHHFFFENVVNVLRERSSITTNANEGMKVVEIIEKIYQDSRI